MGIIDTIREAPARLGRALMSQEYHQLRAQAEAFQATMQVAPYLMNRDHLLETLDQNTLDFLSSMRGFEMIGHTGGKGWPSERERNAMVLLSRNRFLYDSLARRAVWLWTDYGFGQQITVKGADPDGDAIWQDFWSSPANAPILGGMFVQENSDVRLYDGECLFAFFISKANGDVKVRRIPTDEVGEILSDPDDAVKPVLYKRTWNPAGSVSGETTYYRDWAASQEDVDRVVGAHNIDTEDLAGNRRQGTVVMAMNVPFVRVRGRGWPMLTTVVPWARAYQQFVQDRIAVARSRAQFTEELMVQGGSRAVQAIAQSLRSGLQTGSGYYETNPPPGAGSIDVHNAGYERRRLDQSTGASDAQVDSMIIHGQGATGAGIPSFLLGRTDSMQNRATAEATLGPTIRQWERYGLQWSLVFEDMYNLVLDSAEQYGPFKKRRFETREVQVSMANPVDTIFHELVTGLTAAYDRGLIERKEAAFVVLNHRSLGLSDVSEIMDRMFPEEGAPTGDEAEEIMLRARAQTRREQAWVLLGTLLDEAHDPTLPEADRQQAQEIADEILESLRKSGEVA